MRRMRAWLVVLTILAAIAPAAQAHAQAPAQADLNLTADGTRSATWVVRGGVTLPLDPFNGYNCQGSFLRVRYSGKYVGMSVHDAQGHLLRAFVAVRELGRPDETCPSPHFIGSTAPLRLVPGRYRLSLLADGSASVSILGVRGLNTAQHLRAAAPGPDTSSGWYNLDGGLNLPVASLDEPVRLFADRWTLASVGDRTAGPTQSTDRDICFRSAEGKCVPVAAGGGALGQSSYSDFWFAPGFARTATHRFQVTAKTVGLDHKRRAFYFTLRGTLAQ